MYLAATSDDRHIEGSIATIGKNLVRPGFRRFGSWLLHLLDYSPSIKLSQLQLYLHYADLVQQRRPLPSIFEVGYRVFSEVDEDGLLLFLFAALGMKTRTFVDIGAGGVNGSNTANLAIYFGWHGLLIDADENRMREGQRFYRQLGDTRHYPPKSVCARVTRENVNEIIRSAGFEGEVDLLSIDIDGNDYWVWDALECIQPRVVIIETHPDFAYRNIIVPYDPSYVYPGRHPDYHGASPVAMVRLAHLKGYRLVGSNRYGYNTIYAKTSEGVDVIPEVSVETVLRHPWAQERFASFEVMKDWPYVEGYGETGSGADLAAPSSGARGDSAVRSNKMH